MKMIGLDLTPEEVAHIEARRGAPVFNVARFRAWLLVDDGKRPSTVAKRLDHLRWMRDAGFLAGAFGAGPVEAMEAGRAWIATRKEAGAEASATNNDIKVLNDLAGFFGHAGVHFPRAKESPKQFKTVPEAHIRLLLAYSHENREVHLRRRAMILWALKSGMRPSEMAAMDVSDIDMAGARFYVRKPAKGGLKRWLPIEPWVLSPTRPFGAWLQNRPVPEDDSGALWTTSYVGTASGGAARRIRPEPFRAEFFKIARDLGIPFSPNRCRHTRGTELRRRGWDLLYIQVYLGHADPSSTAIYARVHPDEMGGKMAEAPGYDYFNLKE